MSHDQEMGTETILTPAMTSPPSDDPFIYGWRMVPRWDEEGNNHWEKVPLTAWDVLHPEEDDFIVQTDGHDRDCHYLKDAFTDILDGRQGAKVFHDMRVDWQVPGLNVHGPDIVVFETLNAPWPVNQGTFQVKSMGARSVLVVEVTSPNTREIDTVAKVIEYHRAGVPLYVIVDRRETSGQAVVTVSGFRATPGGYINIPNDPNGVWVEALRVWIRSSGDRVTCVDERGNRIPERPELIQQRNILQKERDEEKQRAIVAKTRADVALEMARQEKERAEQEKQRAEEENRRAEQEKQRADVATSRVEREKQRADETAQKLAELEAELRRLRGDTN